MATAPEGDPILDDRDDKEPLNNPGSGSKDDGQKTVASLLADETQKLKKKVTTAAVSVKKTAVEINKAMTSTMSTLFGHSSSSNYLQKKSKKSCFNLVLFGSSGEGKTSAAKAILGQTDLPSASDSSEGVRNQGKVCGRWVSVVELPSLKEKAQQEVMEESFKCISLCDPVGVHAFILVIPVDSLPEVDKGELQTIQDTFSSRVNDFTMILFTTKSDPTDPNFMETDRNIQELLKSCGGRYVVLNIKERKQIPELLEMVETISNKGSRFFTSYMFNRVMIEKNLDTFKDFEQKSLRRDKDNIHSIEKLRKEIEDMKKREEEHTDEIEALQAQLEQERKRKDQLANETGESMVQLSETIEKEPEKEARNFQKGLQQKQDASVDQANVEQGQREASEKQMKENDITEQIQQEQQLQSSPSLPEDVSEKNNPVGPTTATSGQMENVTQTSNTDNTGSVESCSLDCLRIVLIGKTGSGKSSSGNTILGRTEFKAEASPQSVTMKCQKAETEVDGRFLVVVDTPGLFDNNLSPEQVNEELMKCIDLLAPGPHVFLLVIPIGRLSPGDRETFTLIEKVLGENYKKFTMILFTKGDTLKQEDMSIEDYIKDSCDDSCKKLISDCGERYHVFENYDKKNRSQVTELIQKIDELIKVNGGNCYTSDLLNDK